MGNKDFFAELEILVFNKLETIKIKCNLASAYYVRLNFLYLVVDWLFVCGIKIYCLHEGSGPKVGCPSWERFLYLVKLTFGWLRHR